MRLKQQVAWLATAALVTAVPLAATGTDQSEHEMHHRQQIQHAQPAPQHAPTDTRPLVQIPEQMRLHMLANMRDHLLALAQIQEALAKDQFDEAAQIAEQRLGMTSLELHGAHDVAPYMPEQMRSIGTGMHRAASRFALTASDAAATGDLEAALAALAQVTAQCVACHEGFRVR